MNLSKSCLLAVLTISSTAHGGLLQGEGIGVYGDSMSMQYSFWLPLAPQIGYNVFYNGTQLNWVDLLNQSGNSYNFGPTQSLDGESYKSYDAAIAGDTSANLADQVTTLQPLVSTGTVGVVVEIIGANDFDGSEYGTIYNAAANKSYNPLTDPGVISFMNTVMANITNSVNTTLSENPTEKMILSTIPDVGVTPSFRASYSSAAQRAAVTEVTQAVNQRIIALAAQHGFPVLDLYAAANRSLSPLTFGGVTMSDVGGKVGKDEFLSDNFHPGTVVQGLLANAILMADHLAYHDPVNYLSDQYILTKAGVTHSNATTTYFDVSPYVIVTPEPPSLVLAGLAVAASLWVSRRSAGAAVPR